MIRNKSELLHLKECHEVNVAQRGFESTAVESPYCDGSPVRMS